MTEDQPVLGIVLMLGFCILAPMADAVAKMLADSVPLAQVILLRFAVQVVILAPLISVTGRSWHMSTDVIGWLLVRTFLNIAAIAAMVTALIYLPLADAVAIVFVLPFFMLILGKLAFGEYVGHRRWSACLVGFVGTLMVVQPSFINVGWPAVLPVLAAVIFALYMLVTRQIAKRGDPLSQQAISGVIAVLILAPLMAFSDFWQIPQISMIQPDRLQWVLLLALGTLGTGAHLMMTWSLRYAPGATLAPMQYLEIPFATILGFLIFDDLPNGFATAGIAIIILAGLYIIAREQANARALARADG